MKTFKKILQAIPIAFALLLTLPAVGFAVPPSDQPLKELVDKVCINTDRKDVRLN
jgi:hypothetical protein